MPNITMIFNFIEFLIFVLLPSSGVLLIYILLFFSVESTGGLQKGCENVKNHDERNSRIVRQVQLSWRTYYLPKKNDKITARNTSWPLGQHPLCSKKSLMISS